MNGYTIIIADDHPLFRGALRQALADGLDAVMIAEAGSLDDVIEAVKKTPDTDLILLDLAMPGVKGFSGLIFLRAEHPTIPVAIVSAVEDAAVIRRCLELGASGFVPKSTGAETIRTAVSEILKGSVWMPDAIDVGSSEDEDITEIISRIATLTPQQVRVLMMLNEGLLNKQIAFELSVSEATVKAHVSAILQKLAVDSRTQAVIAVNKIDPGQWRDEAQNT